MTSGAPSGLNYPRDGRCIGFQKPILQQETFAERTSVNSFIHLEGWVLAVKLFVVDAIEAR